MQHKTIVLALSVVFGLCITTTAGAGALDGGTAPLASDVAVTGAISTSGGNNTVVGSGAAITYPVTPANGWSNTNIGSDSLINGANNTSLGANTSSTGGANVTIGNQAVTGNGATSSGNVAIGFQSSAVNNINGTGEQGAVAIGYQSSATGKNSVSIGSGAVNTTANSVSFGGGLTPTRVLQNVTAGTLSTDAVNVGQLQAAIAGVSGSGIDTDTVINQAVSQANNYTDHAIDAIRREYSRAIAAVAAAPALPALSPGERAIAVGTGFYGGQQAIGVSIGQALNNGALLNAGISSAGSKPVIRAGAAWKF